VPHDMPIIGYGAKTVNYLRLYSARTSDDFDISIFNQGDYLKAVEDKMASERISKVLYPSDSATSGKELRLLQEYFFVACALRDIVQRYLKQHKTFDKFAEKTAIQMNDTHPSIAVVELMRLLIDDYELDWQKAWSITVNTLSYTNHTLLAEALEKWPIPIFEKVLPRHLQIIFQINDAFLKQVSEKWPEDVERIRRMSIVEEGEPKQLRMAHLAITGSHSINGVAALHSELVKTKLVPDFYELWPEKFNNKTNGVTPRRWIGRANPGLSDLITKTIGNEWLTDLNQLYKLEPLAEDRNFRGLFAAAKHENKCRLSRWLRDACGFYINPESLFDVHAKRIHLYKRQLLNILRVIHSYLLLAEERQPPKTPQTFFFSGKAAPGYFAAKQVIKLIHNVAHVVNQDPRSRDWLTVIFVPDYKVSVAELLIPAADLSEQISTAGMEASGTGNMKFAMNGALTIGTYDGATIEMANYIGEEHMFLFGLKAEEAAQLRTHYEPIKYATANPSIGRVLDALRSNRFSAQEPGIFDSLLQNIMDSRDAFLHLADLDSYIQAHDRATQLYYSDREGWFYKTILNVARMSFFSSDRTIQEYAKEIWEISPCQ